jgi:hypothetical protein
MRIRVWFNVLFTICLLPPAWAATYVVDQRSPNAADANAGTREAPFKTIGKACEIARAGDIVLIRPGVYRESLIPQNSGAQGKPIVFRGEPLARESADHAIIKGSDTVHGFEREGADLWVKRPWRSAGFYAPDFDNISDDPYKASARLDEVFVNELPLRWVPGRDRLEAGSFYWSADELVIRPAQRVDDLNEQLVEVPVRWKVAGAWMQDLPRGWNELIEHRNAQEYQTTLKHLQHITIQGLHFRHSRHYHNRAGVQMAGDHWIVEDCLIDWMNAVGVSLGANRQIIRRNHIAHNGRTMGYLVDAGEPIVLIDQYAARDHTFQSPSGAPKDRVRVFTGTEPTWRDAEVTGAAITVRLSRGVHLVRGLPPDVRTLEW